MGCKRIEGGAEMIRYNDNRKIGTIGVVAVWTIENSRFRRYTRIFSIFMWKGMLLIHLLLNFGTVEYPSWDSFLRLFKNHVYYHFIFPQINKRGGVGIRAGRVGEFFISLYRGRDDYSVFASTWDLSMQTASFLLNIVADVDRKFAIVKFGILYNFRLHRKAYQSNL